MEVARLLWELGEATVRRLYEAFPADRDVDFTTVQTYLRRLHTKGYARTWLEGRTRVYAPSVKPRTVIRETVDDLVDRLFDGETLPLVRHLIEERGIGPKELAELAIQGVEKVNPQINSVIEVYGDALEIVEQAADRKGAFTGVPILRKDIGATETGRLQEMGSRLFKGYVPDHDSYLMTKFREAGLVIFGRTTVPELGIAGQTETVLHDTEWLLTTL